MSSSDDRFCPLCDAASGGDFCPTHQVPTIRFQERRVSSPRFEAGMLIGGRYRIERALGEGGQGWVFAATQLGTARMVVVKAIKSESLITRPVVRRFYVEAQAICRLDHPNIIRVFEFGVDSATQLPFLVMEHVGGETLHELIMREGPLPEARAAALFAQIARAMVAAHARGVLHRDLKPSNVMLRRLEDGQEHVCVLDFGLAKMLAVDNAPALTAPGQAIGTPSYMSPEQIVNGELDVRTDLYGLGCLLHTVLTGRPPFIGDGIAAVLKQHLETRPPELTDVLSDGAAPSRELKALHASLLKKSKLERPESAAVVAEVFLVIASRRAVLSIPDAQTVPEGESEPTTARERRAIGDPAVDPLADTNPREDSITPIVRPDRLIAGKYEIQAVLAQGSTGNVYAAIQHPIERTVALKTIRPAHDALERFMREAKIVAQIESAHSVTLYDFGVEPDGSLYLALELIRGSTLKEVLASLGPLAPARAGKIALQVLDALRAAHDLGLVHRDIKPGNIMLTPTAGGDDFVHVVDFGIAKLFIGEGGDAKTALTRAGSLRGTARYIAPEQIEGRPVSAATDLYSLGCVLFEMLTGAPPFPQTNVLELLQAHVHRPAPALAADHPLAAVVEKCLRKSPADRYASAAELALAIRAALGSEPRGHARPRVFAAAFAGVAAIVAGVTYWLLRDPEPVPIADPPRATSIVPAAVQRSAPEVEARAPGVEVKPPRAAAKARAIDAGTPKSLITIPRTVLEDQP